MSEASAELTPGADSSALLQRDVKMSHRLAMELRRQILSGDLVADQQLPTEAELATAFDVSRDTLREALRILESQSLLEVRRGRSGGAVVRRPGLAPVTRYVALLLQLRGTTIADLEEVRSVLEPPVAERFAVRCSADDLNELARLHHDEQEAGGDPLTFVMAAAGFDQAVTERCGNRTITLLASVFRDIYAGQVFAATAPSDPASTDRIGRRVVLAHGAFLDAARRRDGTLARKAWNDYLQTTSKLLLTRARSREPMDVVPLWRAGGGAHLLGQPRGLTAAVAREIRARIAEGRLRDGDRLPGLPDLAHEFGVSRPTLREALRILEMEFLVELHPGDRNGPTIRHPSAQVAAQLTGTFFESQRTTLEDFYQAVTIVEPAIMELLTPRIGSASLPTLHALEVELAGSVRDEAQLLRLWSQARDVVFGAAGNPALAVITELLQWVRIGVEPAVTADARTNPAWVAETQHLAELIAGLVDAFAARDGSRAASIWAQCLTANSPYIESSRLAGQLVIDLINRKDAVPDEPR